MTLRSRSPEGRLTPRSAPPVLGNWVAGTGATLFTRCPLLMISGHSTRYRLLYLFGAYCKNPLDGADQRCRSVYKPKQLADLLAGQPEATHELLGWLNETQ